MQKENDLKHYLDLREGRGQDGKREWIVSFHKMASIGQSHNFINSIRCNQKALTTMQALKKPSKNSKRTSRRQGGKMKM